MEQERSIGAAEIPETPKTVAEVARHLGQMPVEAPAAAKMPPGLGKFEITDEQVVFLANPGCKHCYGTGSAGSITRKDQPKVKILCGCVHRSLREEGKTPWLLKRARKEKT